MKLHLMSKTINTSTTPLSVKCKRAQATVIWMLMYLDHLQDLSVFTTLVKAFTWKEAAFNINTIVVAGSKEWNEFYIPLFGVYNDDLSCR